MNHTNDYIVMFCIMLISSLLSTMNIWADKFDDVRFSFNDIYMSLLMSGYMLVFMSILHKDLYVFFIGVILVISVIYCIRTQFLIDETQYKLGMIPHHSMAIFMSRQLLTKNNNISHFLQNIIDNQEYEISILKQPK